MAWRRVTSGRGWNWIVDAWALFTRDAALWVGLGLVAMLIFIGMHFIPLLGPVAATVLMPVFVGGLMLGARAADQGAALKFDHLFAGFQEKFGPLAAVGAIALALTAAAALIVGLLMGASLFAIFSQGEVDPSAIAGAFGSLVLALLLWLALMLPVFMAAWFAPALVVLEGKRPAAAMRESFAACLANMGPFLLYGLALLVLSILAAIPFGLGWLVLGPVMFLTCYTGYRDIWSDGATGSLVTEQPPAAP